MTKLDQLRSRASNACLAFYQDFKEENLKHYCEQVVTAWKIGQEINNALENERKSTAQDKRI